MPDKDGLSSAGQWHRDREAELRKNPALAREVDDLDRETRARLGKYDEAKKPGGFFRKLAARLTPR